MHFREDLDLYLLRNILRVYSYIFETVLCLMGLLLTVFALASRNVDVLVPWLPWTGPNALRWVGACSLLGLVCAILAIFGTARALLFVFSGAVVYILARGLFLNTQYAFSGPGDARRALLLVIAATLAFVGSFPMRAVSRRSRWNAN